MLVEALAGGTGVAAALMAWGVRGKSSTLLAPSRHRGPKDQALIALTFDDGPSESTPKLLELLHGYRVPATFFQCGMHARRLSEITRQIVAGGHEIGNHTHSHARLYLRTPGFIFQELSRAQNDIWEVAGITPRLFRPTYGARWIGLRDAQRRLGLTGVMWTIIGCDWKLSPTSIARRLVKGASNGAILCLHDGRERIERPDIRATLEATERTIPELLARGYRFETVSQLLCLKN